MKPKDFLKFPFGSVVQNSESETVALNIMKILNKAGGEFRRLTWDEYKAQRQKDGNFTEAERQYFDRVCGYCVSEDTAKLFSPVWAEA